MLRHKRLSFLLSALPFLMFSMALQAIVQPKDSPLRTRQFRHANLQIPPQFLHGDALQTVEDERMSDPLASLGIPRTSAFLDARTGRWATLMPTQPLLPGTGVGNTLSWADRGIQGKPTTEVLRGLAWQAFETYLRSHEDVLKIDVTELLPARITVHHGGDLIQIYAPRAIGGIPVRGSHITAVINHGNLSLFGAVRWGDVNPSSVPTLSPTAAQGVVKNHVGNAKAAGVWQEPSLAFVPLAASGRSGTPLGQGLTHRLAWILGPEFEGEPGQWEAVVDAHDGTLLSFEDTLHYLGGAEVEGGVYPVSNDGIADDGIEQPMFPMPFVGVTAGDDVFVTDSGGNLPDGVNGGLSTALDGEFVTIHDSCGAIHETNLCGNLDLGTGPGTDCTVAMGASPGNTHAARTVFYELNRFKEMGRGLLPGNPWLQDPLVANTNLPLTCNAFWNGTSVNFGQSGVASHSVCANTGEIASIISHEAGHGLDNNDANPTLSNPSEAIADAYAALRLNTSCIGRGFYSVPCDGYGDHCTECTGVRDIDWAKRESGVPHTIANLSCSGPLCDQGGVGPCGFSAAVESAIVSEAIWDLRQRDFQTFSGLSSSSAQELTTYLTYLAAGLVGDWYTCSVPYGGCNADGGYLNYLAADDDDGNLANGTPHMPAIFAAFNRHGIACSAPTVEASECEELPTTAPVLTATPLDQAVDLSWSAVDGASSYRVYRSDGGAEGEFGAVLVGTTHETSFRVDGLKNGREYILSVVPVGSNKSCVGPTSSIVVEGKVRPRLVVERGGSRGNRYTVGGDGDRCIDNGEDVSVLLGVKPDGNITINVKKMVITSSPCQIFEPNGVCPGPYVKEYTPELQISGSHLFMLEFTASDLDYGSVLEIGIEVFDVNTQIVLSTSLSFEAIQCDQDRSGNFVFPFEGGRGVSPPNLEGWEIIRGDFSPISGVGANSSSTFIQSSSFLDNQIDQIRSPLMVLSPTSTLSLWSNFDVQPMSDGTWYDRANLGLQRFDGGRMVIAPDGGRVYNAQGGSTGSCEPAEDGWAGTMTTWGESTWSPLALKNSGVIGEPVQLDIIYRTDATLSGQGFGFDEVTITDVDLLVPDPGVLFADGFESGDTQAWSTVEGH